MLRASRVSTWLCAGLMLFVLLPGCGRGTFLGNRYNNFRAYYNTFYNAKRAFHAGEEAIQESERQIDRTRFLSIFPANLEGASSTGGPLERAIEKSADLLRERPDSKWADDALLLIGKAYFYQNNVVGAEGKFRETIEAALERDQPELVDEARFWLGRTLTLGDRFDEASAILEEGVARPDIRPKWRSKMQLALGELFVQQRRWSDAAESLRLGIQEAKEKEFSGRAQFLLGQVLEADGRYAEAAKAYEDVSRHRPVFELSYAAKLNEALVLGLDAGDTEGALELIQRMRRDDKNYQNRAEVELAYARILGAANQQDEAQRRFDLLLYDEDFRSNNVRGETYYRFAEFFRDRANDYIRAAVYFDTAATNVRAEPGREELVTRVALNDVRRSAEVYRSYASIATAVAEADSLLYLGSLNEADFQTAIADFERRRRVQWEEDQRILAARRAGQGFGNTPVGRTGEFPVEEGRIPTGGSGMPAVEAGFLNYRDPARSQDAMLAFERVWGDRPLAPNWRRIQALRSAVVSGSGPEAEGDEGGSNQASSAGPPPLDLSNVPRTEEAQAELRAERAELRYELGNVFFLSLGKPDSAAHWYSMVIDEDFDQPVLVRAQYALAEALGIQGHEVEAEELYRQVIEREPHSLQAGQARERLGLPPLSEPSAVTDRVLAEAAYSQAYQLWLSGAYPDAVAEMLELGASDVDEDVSPRALLASGVIFMEWARKSGFDPWQGIPGDLVPEVLIEEAQALGEGGGIERPIVDDVLPPEPDEEPLDRGEILEGESESSGAPSANGELPRQVAPEDEVVEEEHGELLPAPEISAPALEADSLSIVFAAEGDSLIAFPDSTTHSSAENELGATSDSLGDATAFLSIRGLYRIVEARYPGTEYAASAASRLTAIASLLGLPEETVEPSLDSLEVEVDLMAPLSAEVIAAAPEGTFGLEGDVPIDSEVGGFSWKVASIPSPLAAQAMLRNFEERGLRASSFMESRDNRDLFHLLLGQFASVEAAEAARDQLPTTGVGRDLEIVPILGLELLGETDLERFRPD